jgi:membrane protease YdiL (CAAX protease family)
VRVAENLGFARKGIQKEGERSYMSQRNSLVLFFSLAFLLSWVVWGTSIAEANGIIRFHLPQTLAFWGLLFVSLLAAALSGGRAAVMDLLRRILRVRVAPLWYGVALGLTIPLGLIAVGMNLLLGGANPIGTQLSGIPFLVFLITEIGLMILTEETAWRGFALPRLQKQHSALNASLILGVLWGLWHIPLFFIPGSSQQNYPFIGFIALILAISIVFTWLYNHTRGSVFLAGIFHGAFDAVFVGLGFNAGDQRLFWLLVIVVWVFAGALIYLQGAKQLTRGGDWSETLYPMDLTASK